MISRRGFLSALCALPFVGRFIPTEWTVITEVGTSAISAKALEADVFASMQDRPGHSVYSCPFGHRLGAINDCPCKHHEITRQFRKGSIGPQRFSISDWL